MNKSLVSKDQAAAWVALADKKNQVAASLQRQELAAQQILIPAEKSDDYKEIDTALAEYRKAVTELSDERKAFTNRIQDAIIKPLMEPEKRLDIRTNKTYLVCEARSLALRKEEKEMADRANAINAEKAAFRLHIENEYASQKMKLETEFKEVVVLFYKQCLQNKVQKPNFADLDKVFASIKPEPVRKFEPKHLTRNQMMEVFETIEKPDFSTLKRETEFFMQLVFKNYSSDLENTEAAIKHQQEQAELARIEAERKAEEEKAVNTLIATAETVVIEEPKIKRSVEIVVIESEAWAKSVMAAFITNLPQLMPMIKVRSWAKLSIGQMANYLSKYASETGETFKGLEVREVEK